MGSSVVARWILLLPQVYPYIIWLLFIYLCYVWVVKAAISPLRKFPGPRAAAFTGLWIWWHDLRGDATPVIADLHRKHGPVVRLGPREISVNDGKVYNNILYCQSPKFLKAPYFYDTFSTGIEHNMFSTSDAQEHSHLRRMYSRSFSRTNVLNFETSINQATDRLIRILLNHTRSGTPTDLNLMYRCLTLEVISEFFCGVPLDALSAPDFYDPILEAFDKFPLGNFLFMMTPALMKPVRAALSFLPFGPIKAVSDMEKRTRACLLNAQKSDKEDDMHSFQPMVNCMSQFLSKNHLPITDDRCTNDGIGALFAGTDTTGISLAITTWHIFTTAGCYAQLHQELREAIPDKEGTLSLPDLEKLKFLGACIKEGLRIATPIPCRLPRLVPEPGWSYGGHVIPSQTIVSSNSDLMHMNEQLFPSPKKFDVGRWLNATPEELRRMQDCLVPFSKGARACIGQNLALAELHITLARIMRRFKPLEAVDKHFTTQSYFTVVFTSGLRCVLEEVED